MEKSNWLHFIKTKYPNLSIHDVQFNDKGWDNDIIVINNQIVFRFPKSERLVDQLSDEAKILECLSLKKPILLLPRYTLIYDNGRIKGVQYTFLKGESLSEYPMTDLSLNPENAKALGDFLTKLHGISNSELGPIQLKTNHTTSYWKKLYSSIQKEVFPHLNKRQQKEVDEIFESFIEAHPKMAYKKSIIHGDLTPSNMIYHNDEGRVVGIIDFTDAQIGDPAFDFAGIYWSYGPEYTKEVLSWYQTSESHNDLYDRVKNFYGLQPVFHELLYALKNHHRIDWQQALNRFIELKEFTD